MKENDNYDIIIFGGIQFLKQKYGKIKQETQTVKERIANNIPDRYDGYGETKPADCYVSKQMDLIMTIAI